MKLWKVLNTDGSAYHGGAGKWSLPINGKPGKWMKLIKDIEPCKSGYHLCRQQDLVLWMGPAIYEAEGKGKYLESGDKVVYESARLIRRLDTWNEKSARLFACDCAWRVLPNYERTHPDDLRPRKTINAAYLFAHGLIDQNGLVAAWAAARDAAWEAASDAAWDAALAAARDAAWEAASDAAWDAALAAAWDAARAAALAAARNAAWAAARNAAWAATRANASAAESKWQTKRLFLYLYPGGN